MTNNPMSTSPIGVTFIPSALNQAMGPQQMAANAPGGSNLEQAFKILSLRLPQVLGSRAIGAPGLLQPNAGSGSLPPGTNPNAAIFQALIRAMAGGAPQSAFNDFFQNEAQQPMGRNPDAPLTRSAILPAPRPPSPPSSDGVPSTPVAPPEPPTLPDISGGVPSFVFNQGNTNRGSNSGFSGGDLGWAVDSGRNDTQMI